MEDLDREAKGDKKVSPLAVLKEDQDQIGGAGLIAETACPKSEFRPRKTIRIIGTAVLLNDATFSGPNRSLFGFGELNHK